MRTMTLWVGMAAAMLPAVCGALSMSALPSFPPLIARDPLPPVAIDTAETAPAPDPDPFRGALVADAQLDEMRGGYEAHSGLRVAFGIERMVVINGQMVATTSLNLISDGGLLQSGGLRVFSGGQGGGVETPFNLGVIQLGPNNTMAVNPAELAGTVIQNTLDKQKIQNITTINATLNSTTLLRANRLNENLRDAMVGAMRR